MSSVLIVGAGQAGLQLALGLLQQGHEVTVVSNRTAQDIHDGKVMSSQCMFDASLAAASASSGSTSGRTSARRSRASRSPCRRRPAETPTGKVIDWASKLDAPAQSVDQRVKIPGWMEELEKKGGTLVIHDAGVDDLEQYTQDARPRRRRGRQGRDRVAVRARRIAFAVRQADARARAHVRRGHDTAAGLLRRLLQPDPDRRRVLRLPRADHLGPVRDHGLRGRPRRPDGLLGRRDHADRAPGQVEVDPRDVPAVGGGALPRRRADRPERNPRRPLPADGAQARGRATVRADRARARRHDHAQRSDHGTGLEQRGEDGGRLSRRDPGARTPPGTTARSWSACSRRSGSPTGTT